VWTPKTVLLAGKLADVPDDDLVARTRAGDRWAEEALFRKHVDYIAALSFRLLRDRAEAEDVVQDTFLDAFSQLRGVAVPESLKGWLAGIAVHKVHRRFRRRRLKALLGQAHVLEDTVLAASGRSSTSAELMTELASVDAALQQVSDVDRAAWMLRYVEGYVLDDVARLCHCSVATAKRRIGRAHRVVRTHVDLDDTEETVDD
jgi:RNA polymerase sigma-70 factor (ECF subfamily)